MGRCPSGPVPLYTGGVIASIWVPVLAGMVLVLGLLMAGAAVGAFMLWRFGRRKWRAFHSHAAVVGALSLWEATASGRARRAVPASAQDMRQWAPRRVRREMWRAVDQAGAAVRTATDLGAPTAELPSLCRRLHAAAVDLDRVLRIEPDGAVPPGVCAQAIEVTRAASDVQQAAVASASDANGQRLHDLTRDAVQEIHLLDAGLASARAALPHPPR